MRAAKRDMESIDGPPPSKDRDLLMVTSVEKAFRVLRVFDDARPALGLSEIADHAGLDLSAAQRFTHTLVKLGYLEKDRATKRFQTTVKVLELGCSYVRSSSLVKQALPYLLHLSKETEETVNLTVLDGTEIVFVSRYMSRHFLNTDVVIGTRLPAYCTAPGIAIASRIPREEARELFERSELRAVTPSTPRTVAGVLRKVDQALSKGYATQVEEYFHGDMSVAAAVLGPDRYPLGAINIAVSTSRYSPGEMEAQFAPLVVAAAHSASNLSR